MKKLVLIPETKSTFLNSNRPTPAKEHLPTWYKSISPYANDDKKLRIPPGWSTQNTTVKRCVPFLDAMTLGYTITLDVDIIVEVVNDEPTIRWKTTEEVITLHSSEQIAGMNIPNDYYYIVAKWNNGFGYKLPEGYSMFITHPVNRIDLPFYTLSGVVDADTYDMSVQFPFILKKTFEGVIEAGTPVAQIFPVKRDRWKLEEEELNEEKTQQKYTKYKSIIASAYKKRYWNKKEYN